MSKDTLQKAEQKAAEILNIDYASYKSSQHSKSIYLGDIELKSGYKFPAYRGYSGPKGLIGKGGIRMADYPKKDAVDVVSELSSEMYAKLILRGYNDIWRGAKGLILIDSRSLSHEQRIETMRQYVRLMDKAKLAKYNYDIPAGDIGTNDLLDIYQDEYSNLHPDDKYKYAVATGKTPSSGGLEFRTPATGWGVYTAHKALMDQRNIKHAEVSIQGFGTVGAWYSHFASNDLSLSIVAISDQDGMIYTTDKNGLNISKQILDKVNNPDLQGYKIHKLADMLVENNPDLSNKIHISENPNDIITHPTDYFVPAAFGNVITDKNADSIGARIGVIEAANGPTSGEATNILTNKNLDILPDIVANGAGVSTSIMEYNANIKQADMTNYVTDQNAIKETLKNDSQALLDKLIKIEARYKTPNLRVAAAILVIKSRMNI